MLLLPDMEISVTLSYSPAAGFQTSVKRRLLEESQAKLKKHAEKVERDRKLVNLKGEAVVLSLTSDDDLWSYGGLMLR